MMMMEVIGMSEKDDFERGYAERSGVTVEIEGKVIG
jgi:hypothetical protein